MKKATTRVCLTTKLIQVYCRKCYVLAKSGNKSGSTAQTRATTTTGNSMFCQRRHVGYLFNKRRPEGFSSTQPFFSSQQSISALAVSAGFAVNGRTHSVLYNRQMCQLHRVKGTLGDFNARRFSNLNLNL